MKHQKHLSAAALGMALALNASAGIMQDHSNTLDTPADLAAWAGTPAGLSAEPASQAVEFLPPPPVVAELPAVSAAPELDLLFSAEPDLVGFSFEVSFDLRRGRVPGERGRGPVRAEELQVQPQTLQATPTPGVLGGPVQPGSLALGGLGGLMMVSQLRRGG